MPVVACQSRSLLGLASTGDLRLPAHAHVDALLRVGPSIPERSHGVQMCSLLVSTCLNCMGQQAPGNDTSKASIGVALLACR